jgi:hypothetical protein
MKRSIPADKWNRACLLANQKYLPGQPRQGDKAIVRLFEKEMTLRIELRYTTDHWIMSAYEEEPLA